MTFDDASIAVIYSESERDARRILERYGWGRFIRVAWKRQLAVQIALPDGCTCAVCRPIALKDTSRYGRLWEIRLPVMPTGRGCLVVEVENSTLGKDGKRQRYYIPVDGRLRPLFPDGSFGRPQPLTVKNAIASTFGLRGSQYRLRAAA